MTEYEKDKQHYRQADDAWLKSKIENEKDSIRINQSMIAGSERDIKICEEILAERTTWCGKPINIKIDSFVGNLFCGCKQGHTGNCQYEFSSTHEIQLVKNE